MSTTKKTPQISAPVAKAKPAANTVGIDAAPEPTHADRIAKLALGPIFSNAITATSYFRSKSGSIEDRPAFDALQSSIKKMHDGDMGEPEAYLMGQAVALNVIFNVLARRSSAQTQMPHLDTYLRLALKAQNQCRMTLETLATIKNPPVLFARQANINNGGQLQVNNDAAPGSASRAAKTEFVQDELSGETNELLPDARASQAAGRVDQNLEPLGKVDRAKV